MLEPTYIEHLMKALLMDKYDHIKSKVPALQKKSWSQNGNDKLGKNIYNIYTEG